MSTPTIGLLGGMGWPSTHYYYETLNRLAANRLGRDVAIWVNSLPFDALLEVAGREGLQGIAPILVEEARKLEECGAERILLCAVTAHHVHETVAISVDVPMPHVGEAVRSWLAKAGSGCGPVGVMGTRETLEGDILGLASAFGEGRAVRPPPDQLAELDGAIKSKLSRGIIDAETIAVVSQTASILEDSGAASILLACTELPLLASELSAGVPLVDAVQLHCEAALGL